MTTEMLDLELNFTEAKEMVGVLPGADYEAQITSVSKEDKDGNPLVISKPGSDFFGTPMVKVEFTIINDEKFKGRKLSKLYFLCREQWAIRPIVELYQACGQEWSGPVPTFDELRGSSIWLKVEVGKYNDEPNNEIKKVF